MGIKGCGGGAAVGVGASVWIEEVGSEAMEVGFDSLWFACFRVRSFFFYWYGAVYPLVLAFGRFRFILVETRRARRVEISKEGVRDSTRRVSSFVLAPPPPPPPIGSPSSPCYF